MRPIFITCSFAQKSDMMNTNIIFLSRICMLMHAERDIVIANLSVCPFIRPSHFGTVCKDAHFYSFLSATTVENSISGGVKYKRGKICNCPKSPFISDTI